MELLVTVAIIGVLAALLFPSMTKSREAAKTAKCVSNLKSLGSATALYVADNNGLLPSTEPRRPWYIYYYFMPQGDLFPYLSGKGGDEPLVRCPTAKFAKGIGAFSYTSNYWTWGGDFLETPPGRGQVRLAGVARPAQTVSMADGVKIADNNNGVNQTQGPDYDSPKIKVDGSHGGFANILFLDGHVSAMKPSDLKQELFDLE